MIAALTFVVALCREVRRQRSFDERFRASMIADGRPPGAVDPDDYLDLSARFADRARQIMIHGPAHKAPANAVSAAAAAFRAWLMLRDRR